MHSIFHFQTTFLINNLQRPKNLYYIVYFLLEDFPVNYNFLTLISPYRISSFFIKNNYRNNNIIRNDPLFSTITLTTNKNKKIFNHLNHYTHTTTKCQNLLLDSRTLCETHYLTKIVFSNYHSSRRAPIFPNTRKFKKTGTSVATSTASL